MEAQDDNIFELDFVIQVIPKSDARKLSIQQNQLLLHHLK